MTGMQHALLDVYNIPTFRMYVSLSPYNISAHLENFVEQLVGVIEMDLVAGPVSRFHLKNETLQDGLPLKNWNVKAISVFAIIATSHVSLHAFLDEHTIFLDVFSCKEFSIEKVVQLTGEVFSTDIDLVQNVRAIRSPRSQLLV